MQFKLQIFFPLVNIAKTMTESVTAKFVFELSISYQSNCLHLFLEINVQIERRRISLCLRKLSSTVIVYFLVQSITKGLRNLVKILCDFETFWEMFTAWLSMKH